MINILNRLLKLHPSHLCLNCFVGLAINIEKKTLKRAWQNKISGAKIVNKRPGHVIDCDAMLIQFECPIKILWNKAARGDL